MPTAGASRVTPVGLTRDFDMPNAPPAAIVSSSFAGHSIPGVTVYGPRRADNGGREVKRVTAVLDRSQVGRLMVIFKNLDLKGKGKAEDQSGSGQKQLAAAKEDDDSCHDNGEDDGEDDEDDEDDDEGAQLPASKSKNKAKSKGKAKKKGKNNNKKGKGRR